MLLLLAALAPACGNGGPPEPPPPPPAAPTGFTVSLVTTAMLRLTWTDVATNESWYVVERSSDGGATYTQVAILPADTTTYDDLGLQSSTTYFYRLKAVNRGGSSAYASLSQVTNDLYWNGPVVPAGPSARVGHSAVYDSIGQRMIVFGGADISGVQNDLWALSLPDPQLTGTLDPAWSPIIIPGTRPDARAGHSAVFDSVNNRMIVFGGQKTGTLPGALLNDVWVLDLAGTPTWTPITFPLTATPPEPRRDHTTVYDPIRREMTVFGGRTATIVNPTIFLSNTYVLNVTASLGSYSWSIPSSPSLPPLPRDRHAAIHDPLGPRMVIYAGRDNDSAVDGSFLNGETWTFSSVSHVWSPLSFLLTPPLRAGHSAVYDAINRRMLVFGGGNDQSAPFDPPDLWALNLGTPPNWVSLTPFPPSPSGVLFHSAIYDTLYSRMVIFGGQKTGILAYSNEAWWILQ
jgi:hypothetical protein